MWISPAKPNETLTTGMQPHCGYACRPGKYCSRKRRARINPSLRCWGKSGRLRLCGTSQNWSSCSTAMPPLNRICNSTVRNCRPVDNALSGDPITPPSLAGNAHLLQYRLNDLRILGMHGEDTVFEMPRRADRVNVLPHEMRRIEFQPQPLAWDAVENGLHRCRHGGEIDTGGIVLPSHPNVELFANGQVFFVEDIGEGLGLISIRRPACPPLKVPTNLQPRRWQFQGTNKIGLRGCALARIGMRVVGSEVLNADNANACVARRGQNLIDGAVAQVRVEVRARRHHDAFVSGLRGKGELLRRVRRDDGELGIGRVQAVYPQALALPASEQPLSPRSPEPLRMCRLPSKNHAGSKTNFRSPIIFRSHSIAHMQTLIAVHEQMRLGGIQLCGGGRLSRDVTGSRNCRQPIAQFQHKFSQCSSRFAGGAPPTVKATFRKISTTLRE